MSILTPLNNIRYGRITIDAEKYEGQIYNSQAEGRGTLFFKSKTKNGWKYKGEFRFNKEEGKGSLYDDHNTIRYEGQWSLGFY